VERFRKSIHHNSSRSRDHNCSLTPPRRKLRLSGRTVSRYRVLTIICLFSGILAERQEPSQPLCNARGKVLIAQPICSLTDSSNALIPFHAICTPIQTRKKDDNCVITVSPVAPRIRAKRSANP
jgi:hypothetical protein